jgi:glycosyltransferase involved in cell wall biosynthesis
MASTIAIGWELSERHGWGQVGLHICFELLRDSVAPVLLDRPDLPGIRPEHQAEITALTVMTPRQLPPGTIALVPFGNGLGPGPLTDCPASTVQIGVGAFEDTRINAAACARAASYRHLIVHSRWNQRLLLRAGITQVSIIHQGIDAADLQSQPCAARFPGHFVIFSGGKLEFRKGQDIVLAAFHQVRMRYPEAILLTAWHSAWPDAAATLHESPHAPVLPKLDVNGHLPVIDWLVANGIQADSVFDCGLLRRADIAPMFAECDVAVFPNRAEGATNLFAMEAMACGTPVVLSANTGHLDLIQSGLCQTLDDQRPVVDSDGCRDGWGESSVEELVARMESVRTAPIAAREAAAQAMRFIRTERTWQRFAARVIETIRTVI